MRFARFAVIVFLATACSAPAVIDRSAQLGCGPIDGLGALVGDTAYILVGEPAETREGPAAFAELACQLAARQPAGQPLWVGLTDYIGGATGAENAMRARLKDLVAKGAPMVVDNASTGHTTGASRRDEAEQRWAGTILAGMQSARASRALLLLPRSDAVTARVIASERDVADYTPMALFLPDGQVVSLEIATAVNIGAPTIRIYRTMTDGYMGQLALATLTPAAKIAATSPASPPAAAAAPPDHR